jgi:DNA integrity scanning protein DisA with diadenylate cyclase activity
MKEKKLKRLEEQLIEIGLKIAKRNEGALFVVGKTKYDTLVNQHIKDVNVFDNPKLIESLALMDGAVILDYKGNVKAYGALIKTKKVFRNHGTRHSAAMTASMKENTCVLISEEDKKVKIFRNEKMVMQIDAMQRNVEKAVPHAVNILESVGAGAIGTIGTTLLVPTIGIALLPGIVVFGSAYYISKRIKNKFNSK